MAKNMKQRLRDQEKEKQQKHRNETVQEVVDKLDKWNSKMEQLLKEQSRYVHTSKDAIKESNQLCRLIRRDVTSFSVNSRKKVESYRKFLSWKFYAACYFASLLGGLTAVTLCGLYWPTIRRILG
ncbi:hypothetical protein [Fodinibius halophilus]|uniref:Uncharacterized protein n=1 Tax=Fodinibius halophilus TaxID=1736908 RepID=A0A6M1T281_9BACT|nr:hypothetical protein [Fodinibius halophilus]NGP90178.1 hypothetical protein [Fodinibius halophilus]